MEPKTSMFLHHVCAKTSTWSDVGDSVFHVKLTVSKLESLILKTTSEFWGFWKFPTNACSVPLPCSEGASPAPDNIPSVHQCSKESLGKIQCSIQWDPSSLHCLWHCQRMHMCSHTLHQAAQTLEQGGKSAEAGTAWIFSFCSPVRAPLLLLPIPGAPLVLL